MCVCVVVAAAEHSSSTVIAKVRQHLRGPPDIPVLLDLLEAHVVPIFTHANAGTSPWRQLDRVDAADPGFAPCAPPRVWTASAHGTLDWCYD